MYVLDGRGYPGLKVRVGCDGKSNAVMNAVQVKRSHANPTHLYKTWVIDLHLLPLMPLTHTQCFLCEVYFIPDTLNTMKTKHKSE